MNKFCIDFPNDCMEKLNMFIGGSFKNHLNIKDHGKIENAIFSVYRQCDSIPSNCDKYIEVITDRMKHNKNVHDQINRGVHPLTGNAISNPKVKLAYKELTKKNLVNSNKSVSLKSNGDIFYNQEIGEFIKDIENFKAGITSWVSSGRPKINVNTNVSPSRMRNDRNLLSKIKAQKSHKIYEIDAGMISGYKNRSATVLSITNLLAKSGPRLTIMEVT